MSTWFAQYVQAKFQASASHGSASSMSARRIMSLRSMMPSKADPDAASKTVTQQWPGESEPSQHIVYPQIMYIGG